MNFSLKQIMKMINKQSIWMKLLLILLVLGVLTVLLKPKNREGFSQNKKYIMKRNGKIYDKFYSKLFDELFQTDELKKEELDLVIPITNMGKASVVLEIGAGNGSLLELLEKRGIAAQGLEESKDRITLIKQKNPKLNIANASPLKSNVFPPNSFSHIMCLFFTLYYQKNKLDFFKNCYDWLMPGGYLIIHLVNRDKFDPLVPAGNPFVMVSPQKYAKERLTKTKIALKDSDYESNFTLDKKNNKGKFIETFTSKMNDNVRQNEHTLYMEPQSHILSLAKEVGFFLKGKIDLKIIQYEYNYLYILQKEGELPNKPPQQQGPPGGAGGLAALMG